jgi:hypothetical protein
MMFKNKIVAAALLSSVTLIGACNSTGTAVQTNTPPSTSTGTGSSQRVTGISDPATRAPTERPSINTDAISTQPTVIKRIPGLGE